MNFLFSLIGPAQTDDSYNVATLRKHKDVEPSIDSAICYVTKFTVPFILSKERSVPIKMLNGLESNSVLCMIRASLWLRPTRAQCLYYIDNLVSGKLVHLTPLG